MMNILVATNDTYYPRLKIFTNSLRKHSSDFCLHILYSDLHEKNREDFLTFCGKFGIPAKFIPVLQKRSDSYKLIHQITVETY